MKDYKFYEKFFSTLIEDENYRRRGKVFKTRNRFYYYDTGTGKVFECERKYMRYFRNFRKQISLKN